MPFPHYVPLVETTRGGIVESIHYGAIAVCDATGALLASVGDPDAVVYLRSSSKPFQVLPLVEGGGMERFNLNERELAVMCASHSGTDEHVAVISGIQRKLGVSPADLLCGTHTPGDPRTAERMFRNGEENSTLRHNCSGKHTGMLAQALLYGEPIEEYIDPRHPVQQRILRAFSEMTGVPLEEIILGTDGCSAPVFAVPLRAAAFAFARLADPSNLPEPRRAALQRIFKAMTSHPDIVAGPDTFDTSLMSACRGRVLTKGGAEGYQALAVLPAAGSGALGITLKISDGDLAQIDRGERIATIAHDGGGRARSTAAVEAVRQLGVLNAAQLEALHDFAPRAQYNWRRIQVGEIRPVFSLELR
ncbi:MAG TPA: asparaginase [Anaerolineaceae bacterium]|nr:asparaginase [Anaerolineaceae bacterium]